VEEAARHLRLLRATWLITRLAVGRALVIIVGWEAEIATVSQVVWIGKPAIGPG